MGSWCLVHQVVPTKLVTFGQWGNSGTKSMVAEAATTQSQYPMTSFYSLCFSETTMSGDNAPNWRMFYYLFIY